MGSTQKPFLVVLMLNKLSDKSLSTTIITSIWALDKNTLQWPAAIYGKSKIDTMIRAGPYAPKPEPTWKRYAYILLARFAKFEDAEKFLNDPKNADSEHDDNYMKTLKVITAQLKPASRAESTSKLNKQALQSMMEKNISASQTMVGATHSQSQPTQQQIVMANTVSSAQSQLSQKIISAEHQAPNTSASKILNVEILRPSASGDASHIGNIIDLSLLNAAPSSSFGNYGQRLQRLEEEFKHFKENISTTSISNTIQSVMTRELTKFLAELKSTDAAVIPSTSSAGATSVLLPVDTTAADATDDAPLGGETSVDLNTVIGSISTTAEVGEFDEVIENDIRGVIAQQYVSI